MMRSRGVFVPRIIDRTVLAILGLLDVLAGLYVASPLYLPVIDVSKASEKAPLYAVFEDQSAVHLFGVLMLIIGLVLLYAAAGNGRFYTTIVSYGLLAGFLLRLYALIGQLLTIDNWRPPTYLPTTAIVLITGAYWVWVKVSARPTG